MIGMNTAVINLSIGERVLTPRSLILRSFGTGLLRLVALILDADSDPLGKTEGGRPRSPE